MGEVIELKPKRKRLIWECPAGTHLRTCADCGGITFVIHTTGDIECPVCDRVMRDFEARERK